MSNTSPKDKLLLETAKLYFDVRELYIQSEECIAEMKMFLAPLVEERDALDHLMTYFRDSGQKGDSEEVLSQIEKAQSHLIRAYFDIADYICIKIRQYIDEVLSSIKSKQIVSIWGEYKFVREQVVNFSDKISKIRNTRTESLESVNIYKKEIIAPIFDIYNDFRINVEVKIRAKRANP